VSSAEPKRRPLVPIKIVSEAEQRYRDTITHLKSELSAVKHQLTELEANRSDKYSEVMQLEAFFLKCTEESRKVQEAFFLFQFFILRRLHAGGFRLPVPRVGVLWTGGPCSMSYFPPMI
jgi:hypothetical protein